MKLNAIVFIVCHKYSRVTFIFAINIPRTFNLYSMGGKEIEWHCKHYEGRKLMKHFKSGADLAQEMKIDAARLAAVFDTYSAGAKAGVDEVSDWFVYI